MKTLLALAVVAIVATGCVTKEPVQAKEGMIEGVPVPKTAKPAPQTSTLGRKDFRSEQYWSVDMTFNEVDAWYEQRMPKGQSWNSWTWQESTATKMLVTRSYCQKGRDGISVIVVRDEGGNPPGILITQDGSGSGCKS